MFVCWLFNRITQNVKDDFSWNSWNMYTCRNNQLDFRSALEHHLRKHINHYVCITICTGCPNRRQKHTEQHCDRRVVLFKLFTSCCILRFYNVTLVSFGSKSTYRARCLKKRPIQYFTIICFTTRNFEAKIFTAELSDRHGVLKLTNVSVATSGWRRDA